MEIVRVELPFLVEWKCVGGHDPWLDNTFRFEIESVDGGHSRLRFWQHYAIELEDDEYGIYNYNWGVLPAELVRAGHDRRGKAV